MTVKPWRDGTAYSTVFFFPIPSRQCKSFPPYVTVPSRHSKSSHPKLPSLSVKNIFTTFPSHLFPPRKCLITIPCRQYNISVSTDSYHPFPFRKHLPPYKVPSLPAKEIFLYRPFPSSKQYPAANYDPFPPIKYFATVPSVKICFSASNIRPFPPITFPGRPFPSRE